MEIRIWGPDANSRDISGLTVVIDVFRAFSTACYVAENRPEKIIPVNSIDHAFSLRNTMNNVILVGERQGIKIDGFDYGNSPTEIVGRDFRQNVIVHTTTAGTKGLLRQHETNEVITGSFVNARAIVQYITRRQPQTVNLYCTAPKGQLYGEEDYYFADYLKARLLNQPTDVESMKTVLRQGSGRGFCETGFAPESDFHYCVALDRFDFILRRKIVNHADYAMELERVNMN